MDNDTQVAGKVSQDIAWARHHLFLLVAVAVLVIGSIFSIETLVANRAHDQFVQAQAILTQMQKQNEQTQAAAKAEIDALTQQNAVLTQQFQTAMSTIAARDTQLLKDRQEIKTLPPTALATKWGASANEPAPVVQANGDFDVPITLAQKSYDALLQVPVLSANNTDLKSSLTAETQIASNNQKKFEDEQKAHTSDNETCKQNVQTLKDEVKQVKDDARKNNFIVAAVSIVIGFLLHK